MARRSNFSTAWVGGMAVLWTGGALAGLVLADELASGLSGTLELTFLVVAGLLLVAAVLVGRAAAGGWPLTATLAAALLIGCALIVTVTQGTVSSAALFELAALFSAALFASQLRRPAASKAR